MRGSSLIVLFALALGCGKPAKPEPIKPAPPKATAPISTPERAEAAKALFEKAAAEFHNPSADATGDQKTQLLEGAAKRYEQLLQDYPEQKRWCAQALRSLAGVRAEQGDTAAALKHYDRVATDFSEQEFEVLQSWKAAADLLWDAEQKTEAKAYYQKIVARFDRKEIPPVYKIILNISKKRAGD
jgi:tetratricopeptide (TPR) repeat protein